MIKFVRFYNNGIHLYRVWKIIDVNSTSVGYKFVYELFLP